MTKKSGPVSKGCYFLSVIEKFERTDRALGRWFIDLWSVL